MALDTVAGVLSGLSADDATLRLIRDRALATSAVGRIRPPANLTQPSVRGVGTGRLTGVAVAEGSTKTLASGVLTPFSYQVLPVAIIVPISNMLYQSSTDLQKSVISALTEGIAVGIDNEIINNPNSVFSTSLKAAATAAGNTQVVTSNLYNDFSTLFSKVESTYYSVDGVIVRNANKTSLRLATASGVTVVEPLWVPAADATTSRIFGAQTEFVDTRVLPNTVAGSEVIAVAGDFTQLEWGVWGGMKIDTSTEATVGAFNAFGQNLTLVRAEMYIGFAVVANAAFALLTE